MSTTDSANGFWLLCFLLSFISSGIIGCHKDAAPGSAGGASAAASGTAGNASSAAPAEEPARVTIEQVQQWIKEGVPITFLDSRSAAAWGSGTTKVPGAIRVPPDEVGKHLGQIPRDRKIVIYCT